MRQHGFRADLLAHTFALAIAGTCVLACAGPRAEFVQAPSDSAAAPRAVGTEAPAVPGLGPVDPQSTVKSTIAYGIELLERHAYRELFVTLVPPEEVARVIAREKMAGRSGEIDALVDEFAASEKPGMLLASFRLAMASAPEMQDDGKKAHFALSGLDAPHATMFRPREFSLRKIGAKWFIEN